MGWTFPYDQPRRSVLIAERTKRQEWKRDDGGNVVSIALKHCYKGGMRSGVLYIVWDRTITPAQGEPIKERFIEIDLLQFRKDKQLGASWGYKDIDCCMGPCNLSCPVSYLDLCPPHKDHQYCEGWHQKVRAHANAKKAARENVKGLKLGDRVELVEGLSIESGEVDSLKPLVVASLGRRYRLKPDQIDWKRTEHLRKTGSVVTVEMVQKSFPQ